MPDSISYILIGAIIGGCIVFWFMDRAAEKLYRDKCYYQRQSGRWFLEWTRVAAKLDDQNEDAWLE